MAGGLAVEVCVTGHVVCTVREQRGMIAGQLTFYLFFIHSRPSAFGRAVALAIQVGLLSLVNPLWGHPFGHP